MVRRIFAGATQGRPRAGWRIVLGLGSMMVLIGVLATAVDAIEIPFVESFLWQLLAAPAMIGLALLLARLDRREFAEYGLRWEPLRLGWGILIGAALAAIAWLGLRTAGWIEVGTGPLNRYEVPVYATLGGFALRYAGVSVFEELMLRGFLITNLAEGLDGRRPRRELACVLAALVFGLLHMTNDHATLLGGLNVALFGLLFGLLYLRSGTLSLPIGAHFAWNFTLGPVLGLPVSGYEARVALVASETGGPLRWTGGDFGPEGSLLATILLLAAVVATRFPPPVSARSRA